MMTILNNGYSTSDVYLKAAPGYRISTDSNGPYRDTVPYSDGNVYLERIDDGARTTSVGVSLKLKVDKDAPEIAGTESSVIDGSSFYSDGVGISVSDPSLARLTVNGSSVNVTNGKATITRDPENGTKTFNIRAEDEAGNVSTLRVTVMAAWLKTKIIPANKRLPLVKRENYRLGSGMWRVSGDSTVYSGGSSVFVRSDGNYSH